MNDIDIRTLIQAYLQVATLLYKGRGIPYRVWQMRGKIRIFNANYSGNPNYHEIYCTRMLLLDVRYSARLLYIVVLRVLLSREE
jgi:hypothetical protein